MDIDCEVALRSDLCQREAEDGGDEGIRAPTHVSPCHGAQFIP